MDACAGSCRWQVVAASVVGVSHEKTGQPCQDFFLWKVLPENVLVAAVADGAGSAVLGYAGAVLAVRTAIETVCSRGIYMIGSDREDWQPFLTDIFKRAREAIESEAVLCGMTSRDLATTLIIAIASPEFIAVAQVGDGAVVIGDYEGNIVGLTVPHKGEYINETTFLISPDAFDAMQVTVCYQPVKHIAILSDGLQMLAFKMPDGIPHKPFFSPLFRFMSSMRDEKELKAFLCSRRVKERTDDDLTLLLATFG